jgi:hypothetical protein
LPSFDLGCHVEWRQPLHPVATPEYAAYVRILTWFLDTPAPQAPFSVHRMALAGKELGTDVGQWFGPSVAAGAIKCVLLSSSPIFHPKANAPLYFFVCVFLNGKGPW